MQLRHVFTELGQGLRRNLSMHLAVVLTLLVSLTLAGLGLLLNSQADKAEEAWGNELQITVFVCNGVTDSSSGSGVQCNGAATDAQKKVIEQTFEDSSYVESYELSTKKEEFERLKMQRSDSDEARLFDGPDAVITPKVMHQAYWVTMSDPKDATSIVESVQGLDGVYQVQDQRETIGPILNALDALQTAALVAAVILVVAALLLVANTIRLAAYARRREIGIMRLVGASTLYIALPFLLEALVTAVVGFLLAGGALALVMWLGVKRGLAGSGFTEWVGWSEYFATMGIIGVLGLVLTLVPTLLLTRKYLRV